ncbi:MAG: hypothetical protein ACPGXK_08535 [Phycisphaerae bacterium]
MKRIDFAFAAVLVAGLIFPVHGQQAQEPYRDVSTFMDQGLAEQIQQYDWNAEAPFVRKALTNVWDKNQWNSPGDKYALELALQVSEIPPWEPMKRIDFVANNLADRYDMTSDGAMRLKSKFIIGLGEFFGKHGSEIVKNVREAVNGRIAGEPFTAEQISEWIERGEVFRDDADALTDSMIDEIEKLVGPGGRRNFELDISSYRRRMERVDQLTERWREGKWQPSDWGMQDDPIQKGIHPGVRVGNKVTVDANGAVIPTTWIPHDPDTWIAYLVAFKRDYGLSNGQITTAESIHNEMTRRAVTFRQLRRDRLGRIPAAERSKHPDYEPILDIFAELQERLDGLLSDAQRVARTD